MLRNCIEAAHELPAADNSDAMGTQKDMLSALPTELQREIIFFTRSKEDCAALSLVNRVWKDVTLPLLWERLDTPFSETNGRRHIDLVHPKSNILKHLRYLRIKNIPQTSAILTEFLPHLLAAIPNGQLREFETCRAITPLTLRLLMQLHPHLEVLDVPGRAALTTLVSSQWALGSFASLKNTSVYVDSLQPNAAQALLDQCPNISILHISVCFTEKEYTNKDISPQMFEPVFNPNEALRRRREACGVTKPTKTLMQLRELVLHKCIFPRNLEPMFARIDFSALTTLSLSQHSNPEHLLHALARHYTRHAPALERLYIKHSTSPTDREIVKACESVLNTFQGLHELHFIVPHACWEKLNINAITRHGATLKSLFLEAGYTNFAFSMAAPNPSANDDELDLTAVDLALLATSCPNLEQLALPLYYLLETDQDEPDHDILGPDPQHAPHVPTEFEAALDAIARMKNLHTLRITDPKSYEDEKDSTCGDAERAKWRHAYQARADGLIRYLAARGSGVKVFGFSPAWIVRGRASRTGDSKSPDKNGHYWPHYFYSRGTVTDGWGGVEVTARPLRAGSNEFPQSTVLGDFHQSGW